MFDIFFRKSKLKSADPLLRLAALNQIETPESDLLLRLATEDPDSRVRVGAIKRISDPLLLEFMLQRNPHADARTAAAAILNDIRYRLSMQGISLDDYCKYTGTKTEVMKAEMKNEAERRVKTQLVLDAIMKAEGIKAENDEVDKKIDEYCAQFDDKAEEFKAKLNEDDKAYFEDQVLLDKTINMLVDSAIEK